MPAKLGEQNDPGISTDPIYTKEMTPYEDSMDFFDRKEVKVTRNDTDEIYGAEAALVEVIEGFGKNPIPTSDSVLFEEDEVGGMESFGDKARAILARLIQLSKDAFNWVMNIINNQLSRLDNRQFRTRSQRKRYGIKTGDVKYPNVVKRLLVPNKVTEDGQWVKESLKDVKAFYKGYVNAHKALSDAITMDRGDYDLTDVIKRMADAMGLTAATKDKDGTVLYVSDILPGNRHFKFRVPGEDLKGTQIFFDDSSIEVKLRAEEFGPTSFIIDATLDAVHDINEEIRKNQKNVNELHRKLERDAKIFMADHNSKLTPSTREFIQWLINTDKLLSSRVINYVINSTEAGLDFVKRGINS